MRPPRWTLRNMLFLIAIFAVVLAAERAIRPKSSNCGGNTAALHDVHSYALIVRMAVADNTDHQFRIASATPEQRAELARIADDFMIRPARFLVSRLPYRDRPSEKRRLIIVCNWPFTNVVP